MNDLVSIVLPIYNGEKYMRESIESVIAQTYKNWELLILDDCSTDNTAIIANEYVNKDSRIKYFKNENNLRLPGNLNKGFSLAKGDYLTWTSDDNRYRPTAIEKMYKALSENNDNEFVFASCRIINDSGEEIEYIMVNENSKKQIVGKNPVGACFMYTRNVYQTVGEYNPQLVLVEDFDYWQRIVSKFNAITIEEILYDYRWHSDALTSTMKKDQFYKNLEKTLLNNIEAFGKLDYLQKYYFYKGLYDCETNLNSENNIYKTKFALYKVIYILRKRVPHLAKRLVEKIFKSSGEK